MSSVNEMTCSICLCGHRARTWCCAGAAVREEASMPRWCYFYEAPRLRRRRMRGPMKNQLTRKIIKDEKQKRKRTKRASGTWGSGSLSPSSPHHHPTIPSNDSPLYLAYITSKQLQRNVAPPWIRMAMAVIACHTAIANCRSHERWVKKYIKKYQTKKELTRSCDTERTVN